MNSTIDKLKAEELMREAILEARRGEALGEVPVGALMVESGRIVAQAHNLVESKQDVSCHAEMLVLREAARQFNSWRLSQCSLFVTLEPCPMCMGAIVLSRIDSLYFGAWDPRMGAAGSRFDLSDYPGFPHAVKVIPEVLAADCQAMLGGFFEKRRGKDSG